MGSNNVKIFFSMHIVFAHVNYLEEADWSFVYYGSNTYHFLILNKQCCQHYNILPSIEYRLTDLLRSRLFLWFIIHFLGIRIHSLWKEGKIRLRDINALNTLPICPTVTPYPPYLSTNLPIFSKCGMDAMPLSKSTRYYIFSQNK
jgi:hypothetical protein